MEWDNTGLVQMEGKLPQVSKEIGERCGNILRFFCLGGNNLHARGCGEEVVKSNIQRMNSLSLV